MENEIKKDFLRDHFRKHNSITLYKRGGPPSVFTKQYHIKFYGGHRNMVFNEYNECLAFCKKQNLRQRMILPTHRPKHTGRHFYESYQRIF